MDHSLIETRGLSDEIMKCIHIGLLCVQKAESRPKVASVVLMLNAHSYTLPRPSQPAFLNLGVGVGVAESSSRDNHIASLNSVTISELDPR